MSVHQAKTHLSRLLRQVMTGEEVIIERRGEPIAKLVPFTHKRKPELWIDEGVWELDDEAFREPDEEIRRLFEGDEDEE